MSCRDRIKNLLFCSNRERQREAICLYIYARSLSYLPIYDFHFDELEKRRNKGKKKKKVPVLFNRFHLRNDDLKDKDISIDESTFKRYGLEIELIRFL